ncbi:MAG: permease of the drug/metabolite transporter superfamily [Frankiales bacterium]|nr:permease of the drug/metabolite transporter superfamily [Frankiales bacterium]
MSQRVRLWVALGLVYVIWGSTYLGIRVLVETAPPLLSSGARFAVAGLVLALGVAAVRGPGALRTSRRQLASCTAIGGLLLLGGNGLVVLAERDVASSVAALMIATVPLVVVLIRLISGDRPARATVVSVAIGLAGIALLVGIGDGGPLGSMALLILAPVSWALGSWLSPRLTLPADPLAGTAWQMLTGGALMAIAGTASGEWHGFTLAQVSGRSWFAWAYLVVAGSLVAFTAYIWLLQHAPLSVVATYAYVNPAIAVILGAAVLNERLTPGIAIGALAIVASVAIVVSTEATSRRVIRVMRPREAAEDACAEDTTGAQHCTACTASCALAAAAPAPVK